MDVSASRGTATAGRHRQPEGLPGPRQHTPLLVRAGRATLAFVPVMWVAAYLTRPIWFDAPIVDGVPDHPLATTFFVLSLTIGAVTPLLLLPVGLALYATVDPAGVLTVPTVLGRRRLELDHLTRIGALTARGSYAPDQYSLYLRGPGFRWVLVLLGPVRRLPSPLREHITAAAEARPDLVSARARTMLRLGTRPGAALRIALGAFTFVVGTATFGACVMLAWALILVGWMPLP